jgi:hypothetical protein
VIGETIAPLRHEDAEKGQGFFIAENADFGEEISNIVIRFS